MATRISCTLRGFVCLAVLLAGCGSKGEREVVVYSALDREFSEPLLKQFEKRSGIRVLAKYDIESTKTVGLTSALLAEANRPRCDLFWNNEILHTLRLENHEVLAPFVGPSAADWPENYQSSQKSWYGLAARARILIVNTQLVDASQRPDSILDLADPAWKGKVGIAKPLFGTTATHAAVLFSYWGEERARAFFREVSQTAEVLSGNKQVALDVASGRLAFGLTDTDDAIIELDKGAPVEILFPDQGNGGMGTLFIPNTVALIKNSPHPEHARLLMEFLLSPEVESQLASGPSAQFPVNPRVDKRSRMRTPEGIRWMPADFEAAAREWESASRFLTEIFATGSG